MADFAKVEKVVLKVPPPAFSDIAKASNDVCLATYNQRLSAQMLTLPLLAHQ